MSPPPPRLYIPAQQALNFFSGVHTVSRLPWFLPKHGHSPCHLDLPLIDCFENNAKSYQLVQW